MVSQILIIIIISLAAAGLAVWMQRETSGKSSCGSSCGGCTKCDEPISKLSKEQTSSQRKEEI